MKRLRPTYFLFATALVFAVLQQSGNVAAAGPVPALWLLSGSYASLFSGTTSWWITCAICGNRHFHFRWSWQTERS